MIAPVTVAGILIMAILAAISTTNQAFAYSSYHKAYYKGHHGYYKSSKYTKTQGNIRASKSVTTANAAQGASNTVAQGGPSGQPSGAAQATSQKSSIGANEKSCALTLNVSPATMGASSYNVNGRLSCGGSGIGGASIAFTANGKFYGPQILKRVVTGSDGSFSQTTTQPLSKVEARYSGELGVNAPVQATFSLRGANTPQQANNGNAAQASNTEQGAPSSQAGHCKSDITQLSATYYPPYKNWRISGELTCGGSGQSGKTIILTNSKLSYVGKLGTVVTGATGLGGGGFFVTSSIKPTATTAKPGSTLSAWYLGGPDEGGIASKTITLPQIP